MRYISPDDKGIGFAAGEAVTLKWEIYEESSEKIPYKMNDDDVITFVVRRGASPMSEVLIEATGEPGSNEIMIPAEDTQWIAPGRYTAFAVISIPQRGIEEMVFYPPIGDKSEGIVPCGNCVIAAGRRGVLAPWQQS